MNQIYLLHHLLQQSSCIFPTQIAILDKNKSITYKELDNISDQLAQMLIKKGLVRGDRVGIYLNKSINSVIAIFGILKAGGVYVPLDPVAPSKRISLIINNCQMKFIISNWQKIANIKNSFLDDFTAILTDELNQEIQEKNNSFQIINWSKILQTAPIYYQVPHLNENDLAYILYTSGSTGVPKGVMISHRAALTFINWSYDCFQIGQCDRISNHAPFHFDLSIFDIFTTIKAGATVILIPLELSVFPRNLAQFINEQKITIWYSVPSALIQLLLHGNLEKYDFSALQKILFAGEVFPIKYLRQLMEILPQVKFYNLYGPTETNVCTYYQVEKLEDENPIPIGKACENTEIFAINEQNQIAQIGEIGELYVRSASVMKGYYSMREKTQEVLVPYNINPNLSQDFAYKTGDLVRQKEDGNYLYLGRKDTMIKSRGYRIEAGEIETVLYGHPAVQEVAVIPIPDPEIGNQIKAVVVIREGILIQKKELQFFCAELLAKYMIPSIIEFRSFLPKTSTGKIDRKALIQEHL